MPAIDRTGASGVRGATCVSAVAAGERMERSEGSGTMKRNVECDTSDALAMCSVSGVVVPDGGISLPGHVRLDAECPEHCHWPLNCKSGAVDGGKRLPREAAKPAGLHTLKELADNPALLDRKPATTMPEVGRAISLRTPSGQLYVGTFVQHGDCLFSVGTASGWAA